MNGRAALWAADDITGTSASIMLIFQVCVIWKNVSKYPYVRQHLNEITLYVIYDRYSIHSLLMKSGVSDKCVDMSTSL